VFAPCDLLAYTFPFPSPRSFDNRCNRWVLFYWQSNYFQPFEIEYWLIQFLHLIKLHLHDKNLVLTCSSRKFARKPNVRFIHSRLFPNPLTLKLLLTKPFVSAVDVAEKRAVPTRVEFSWTWSGISSTSAVWIWPGSVWWTRSVLRGCSKCLRPGVT
jgi:hypothetical protein